MRIIGSCPACGADGTIVSSDRPGVGDIPAVCLQCKTTWPDFFYLVGQAEKAGQRLIPVQLLNNQYCAFVNTPLLEDIPFARLVQSVACTALVVEFDIGINYASEGGVKGMVENEPIDLSGDTHHLGLFDEYDFEQNPRCQAVLRWYHEFLELVLTHHMNYLGLDLGRGQILQLNPYQAEDGLRATALLWVALRMKSSDTRFRNEVFRRLRALSRTFQTDFLAGLTDAQVVKRFVTPPGLST